MRASNLSAAVGALALPPRLKTLIAGRIRECIATGQLALGQRLSDKQLADEMRVSRTPVREALLQLQTEGMVVMRPQSGTFVFELSLQEIAEICELRGIFETGALRVGAAAGSDHLAQTLRSHTLAARAALKKGDLARCEALDTAFHESIIDLSGNRLLVEAYKTISDKVRALRHRLPHERKRFAAALAQHETIVEAIARGRTEAASEELADHVRNVHRLLSGSRSH